MNNHYSVIIVGGGQAGLSISYLLKQRNIRHIIFEKNSVGYAWRDQRWDSFCLVTPNWQCRLPGFPYDAFQAEDKEGFMVKEQIVQYLREYVASFDPPIREGVSVTRLAQSSPSGFEVKTSDGEYTVNQVVIATGGYHDPKIPAVANQLPDNILQLHSVEYKNPESLPDNILIVGTGQSGCQIAEDLHLAGKTVRLATGSAPRAPRRYRGKDVVEWLELMGHYDLPIDEHPQKETVRHKTNHYVTGRDGGREIDLRRLALEGMYLYGRLETIQDGQFMFADDLKNNLDQADATVARIKKNIDDYIESQGIEAPTEEPYQPLWEPQQTAQSIATSDINAVIWSTGFSFNYQWVDLPVFNDLGEPVHERGVSELEGLYFLGLPWLYTWGSGRFSGLTRDAEYLTEKIAQKIPAII